MALMLGYFSNRALRLISKGCSSFLFPTIQRLRYPCGTANPLFNSVMPILYVPD
jgi:hypothetical protein